MEVPVPEKRSAAQNLLEAPPIPLDLLRMADLQWEEECERIRAWSLKHDLNISNEHISELANKETFECFARQRRYLQGALRRAQDMVGASGYFPNHNDYLAKVEMLYVQEVGMAFCNVTDSLGGQLATTVDELARRCVNSEAGSSKQGKLMEDLQDRVDTLTDLINGPGPGRGNQSG
jgi:hypothetical protein